MLKIKDNVDLKELEKFGFKKHKNDNDYTLVSKWGRLYVDGDSSDGHNSCGSWSFYPYIKILTNRYIRTVNHWDFEQEINRTLFDLIQAGLVEKVETNDR